MIPSAPRPPVVPFVGNVILSADRLFGVSSWSSTSSLDFAGTHAEAEASGTMVNVLWSNTALGSGGGSNHFAMPRLSIDGFVAPNVTLGGSVGFISISGSAKASVKSTGSPGTSSSSDRDFPDTTAFIVSPRIGGVVMAGERVAFWLRGGITYFHSSSESTTTQPSGINGMTSVTTTTTSDGTALTIDPQIVILPADHVGLTIGPAIDVGLGGSTETKTTPAPTSLASPPAADSKISSYGAAAGLLVFF